MMCSSFPIYLCLWFLLVTASQILLPYWKLEISKLSLLHPLWSWKCKGLLHLLSPIVMWQSLCFLQWTKKLQIQVYDTGAKEYQLEHKKQPFSVRKRMHLSAVLIEGLKVSSFNNNVSMNESDFHQNEEGTSHASSTHPFLIMPCIFVVFI